ncbi:MAG: TonB-dependent receptor [Cytophagaceae bacterium]|jgi:outer membrane receptor protein involved in Fe transport|nr:TonB-dependent receptor [Cytophagaceae bacterium]
MKKIIISLLLYITFSSLGQSYQGVVLDAETQEPVPGAQIRLVKNSQVILRSNNDGMFQLDSISGEDSLVVSMMGYESQKLVLLPEMKISLRPDGILLQPVIVTANREASLRSESPIAISTLTAKQLDETKATQLYELINKTPGVIMPSYNTEQHAMAIRQPMGTSAYYLYMEDGVPIRPLGIFNHNALLEVNQFAISSVEVVKGPVSSVYGPEAVGGAVNFILQRPTAVPTARLGFQLDSWGHRRVQFGGGARIKKFGFYVGGLSSVQTNSWMTNSDYDKNIVNVRLEYAFKPSLRLVGNLVYGKYYSQMSGSVDSAAFYKREYISTSEFTYRKSDAYRSRLTLEKDWSTNSRTFVTLFQRNNKHGQNPSYAIRWNPTPSATNDPTKARGEINSNNFESYGVILQHSQQFKFLSSSLIAGAVFDYSTNDYWSHLINLNAELNADGKTVKQYTIAEERPDVRIANYDGVIKNYAGYLQLAVSPIKKLKISLGGRYDYMDLFYKNNINSTRGTIVYNRFTPKIGATYDLGKNNGFYVNYSQGFSPPSLTAIFRPKPNTNPVEFYTNLEPAVFQNYELGFWTSYWKNRVFAEITLYQMDGTNELLNIRQPDNSFDYQSAGKTLHKGIEFALTAKPSKQWAFRFGGTNALHRFEDFQVSNRASDEVKNLDGFEMPSAPRWSWNTELSYYPAWFKNFRTSLEWQYVSGWYQNQINTVRYEGFHLINYRVGYKWKGVEFYSNVLNVTNALIAYSASRGNNATDRSTYNPGAPRNVVVGLQYNFKGKEKK